MRVNVCVNTYTYASKHNCFIILLCATLQLLFSCVTWRRFCYSTPRASVCICSCQKHKHTRTHTHATHTLNVLSQHATLFYSSRWNAKLCGSGWAENKPATGRGLLLPHYTNFKVSFLMQLLLPPLPLLLLSLFFTLFCSVLFFCVLWVVALSQNMQLLWRPCVAYELLRIRNATISPSCRA